MTVEQLKSLVKDKSKKTRGIKKPELLDIIYDEEDEIKVLRMLKKYADDIRNKMDEKDKILSDHKKRIDF